MKFCLIDETLLAVCRGILMFHCAVDVLILCQRTCCLSGKQDVIVDAVTHSNHRQESRHV